MQINRVHREPIPSDLISVVNVLLGQSFGNRFREDYAVECHPKRLAVIILPWS